MKTTLTLVALTVAFFSLPGTLPAEVINDSINYSVQIDDIQGSADAIVKLPLKIKNAIPFGAFYIRIEYDTSLLEPYHLTYDKLAVYYDSLELAGQGWQTITLKQREGSFLFDTIYNIWATDHQDSNVVDISFLPTASSHGCNLPVNTGVPSTVLYLLFQVKSGAVSGQTGEIRIMNDTTQEYRYLQFSDTLGFDIILPGSGPMYDAATFTVEDALCGDINGDNIVNLADITRLIAILYRNDQSPYIFESGDINSDGYMNLRDISYLIKYVLRGGPQPHCTF